MSPELGVSGVTIGGILFATAFFIAMPLLFAVGSVIIALSIVLGLLNYGQGDNGGYGNTH